MRLRDIDSERIALGKGALLYAPVWDFDSDLNAALDNTDPEVDSGFLAFTEGEINLVLNETYNTLETPEYTGDAPKKAFIQGEAPILTAPVFAASSRVRRVVSPTGNASGGYRRQRPVVEYTVVVLPEELFINMDPTGQEELPITFNGTDWLLGGTAMTASQQELFDAGAAFLWRGFFRKPEMAWVHEGGGKLVRPAEFVVMDQPLAPNGSRLYHLGNPVDVGVDITTGITES